VTGKNLDIDRGKFLASFAATGFAHLSVPARADRFESMVSVPRWVSKRHR
jgi:hypothetical protein